MRIIGGKYKSRRIQVPPNLKARPTTDFAREGLFNVLNNLLDWEETTALDLFSGTGSIAFELISRGCPYVVSVEQNQHHFNFICRAQEKLETKELFPVKADVFKYLQSLKHQFDFIFADPPYDLPDTGKIPKSSSINNWSKREGYLLWSTPKISISHIFPILRKNVNMGMCIFPFLNFNLSLFP